MCSSDLVSRRPCTTATTGRIRRTTVVAPFSSISRAPSLSVRGASCGGEGGRPIKTLLQVISGGNHGEIVEKGCTDGLGKVPERIMVDLCRFYTAHLHIAGFISLG